MRPGSRGAALLAAMLTVALVATFAAAALWQQWRSVEVETAERARVQSAWILAGALDWARLVLREDARSADHLGEPWAVPLQEARLSSFLAADRNATAETGPEVLEAFLSGEITDQQSMLNVRNLIRDDGTAPSDDDVEVFARLFELLGLPPEQLAKLTENLRFALDTSGSDRPGSTAPLLPQQIQQLVWLGIPARTVTVLQPYVTVLPVRTAVNFNTARAEVIYASLEPLSMADAQRLVATRERSHFRTIANVKSAIGLPDTAFPQGLPGVGVASRFFEVRSRLRLDQLTVEERSLVQRDGTDVRILRRQRVPPAADAPASAAAAGGR